ncbi:MAG: GGDEF and EAL domain-containing protein [bacterium]
MIASNDDVDGGNGYFSLALDVAGDGVVEWDLTQQVVAFSARWCELMGLPAVSMVATVEAWERLVHQDDAAMLFATLNGLTAACPRTELSYRVRCADASYKRMTLRATLVCDANGVRTRILAWQNDRPTPSTSRASLGELRDDAASPLAGQLLMTERLDAVVAQTRREGRSNFVMLAIDVDGFTAISASYGKEAANRLLAAVGERLRSCVHPLDTVARYGCDEFCVLLRCSSDSPLATTVSEQIQRALADPFMLEGRAVAVSVSVGIARVLPTHYCAADVSRDAYAAVHHAKMSGGNQCALFDDGMHETTKARLQLEAELRHAFERGQFRLHYQPIVSCVTGALVSLEALIRWEHPTRGCLPPSAFLDVLASTGLLNDVGRWIVGEACRQLATWRKAGACDAYISINVSPMQLVEQGFIEDVVAILAETGASPGWIAFEITEDLALGDTEIAMRALIKLREHGIRVRIDDFGTGYSSLSYLQRLPVGGLKIDRTFLEQFESDAHRRAIVGAIIQLAHVLGVDVVAEGVERREQLEELRVLNCDLVQGYFLSPPLSSDGIRQWIERRTLSS